MEGLYRLDPAMQCSDEVGISVSMASLLDHEASVSFNSAVDYHGQVENFLRFDDLHVTIQKNEADQPVQVKFQSEDLNAAEICESETSSLIKAQIACHSRYPSLLAAYIECRKVGAPLEVASLLDEISLEIQHSEGYGDIGADPELDEFMESYCEVLLKYKSELAKPMDEASSFLNEIETQLCNLCKGMCPSYPSDEVSVSSSEEPSSEEVEEAIDNTELVGDLKEKLLQKYSGYLSSLRREFLKTRKKGRFPSDARLTLLNWWNTHNRWPYPTVMEEEKIKLGESTGLDQTQINNWFINQRKRHWKPSQDLQRALYGADNS